MNDWDRLKLYINEGLNFASDMYKKSKNKSDTNIWSGEIAAYNNVIDYIDNVLLCESKLKTN